MILKRNIPLYFSLYHKIKRSIFSGEIQKGGKIGSIEELARQYDFSKASVRKALDLLANEGLILKSQGWDTIVPEDVDLSLVDLGEIIRLHELEITIREASVDFLFSGWTKPEPQLIHIYGDDKIPPDRQIYKMHTKVNFPKKEGVKAIQFIYVAEKIMHEIVADSLNPLDILLSLAKRIQTAPLKYRDSLRPILCTDTDAESLGIPDGTPIFYQSMAFTDFEDHWCFHVDMLSTANIRVREDQLNI